MSEFDTTANVSLSVADSELRSIRNEIESALSDIEIGVSANVSGPGRQPRDPRSGQFMSKRGPEQRLVEQQRTLDDLYTSARQRNEYLEVMVRELDDIKDAVGGGGGLGGPRLTRRGSGGGGGGLGGFGGVGGLLLGGGAFIGGALIGFLQNFEFDPPDIPPLDVPEIPPLELPELPEIQYGGPDPIPVEEPSDVEYTGPTPIPVEHRFQTPSPSPSMDPFPFGEPGGTPTPSPSMDPFPFGEPGSRSTTTRPGEDPLIPPIDIGPEEIVGGAVAVGAGGLLGRTIAGFRGGASGAGSGIGFPAPSIIAQGVLDRLGIDPIGQAMQNQRGRTDVSTGDTTVNIQTDIENVIEDAMDALRGEQEQEREELRRQLRRETGIKTL